MFTADVAAAAAVAVALAIVAAAAAAIAATAAATTTTTTTTIRFFLVVRHMSSIGFDGKLEPAFFQHILIGRVEHQPFHDGMDELEPFQHQA